MPVPPDSERAALAGSPKSRGDNLEPHQPTEAAKDFQAELGSFGFVAQAQSLSAGFIAAVALQPARAA